jgi:predicted nucleic acid-binding protein
VSRSGPITDVVLDSSVMVDLMTGTSNAAGIRLRLSDSGVQIPAHFDAEVLAAFGRFCRAGQLTVHHVTQILRALRHAPFSQPGPLADQTGPDLANTSATS